MRTQLHTVERSWTAFFSPGSSVRPSALRASAAHNFYYRNGDKGEIVSCKKRSLELFKLQHKTGSAMNYSSKKAGEVKMQRKEKTNELLVNEVLEEPIFELGGSINCQ